MFTVTVSWVVRLRLPHISHLDLAPSRMAGTGLCARDSGSSGGRRRASSSLLRAAMSWQRGSGCTGRRK